jgi:hypothetical protein
VVPGSNPNTLLWCRFLSWWYQTYCFAFLGLVFACFYFADIAVCLPWSRVERRGHSHDLVSKLKNRAPWSGLVAKSPIIFPVGHHTTDTSSFLTCSVIKKYRMLMCFVRFLLEAFTFFSKRIELLLSWNKTLSLTPYPCALIKYRVQQMASMKSSAPTISVSVELQVLSFCFVELTIGNPRPSDSPPPE